MQKKANERFAVKESFLLSYILHTFLRFSCKIFVEQVIRFPSAMFIWPTLGVAIDQNNGEEMATQFLFAQHLEDVVDSELSTVNYALKVRKLTKKNL